jgi:S1-C subfamily serine protease
MDTIQYVVLPLLVVFVIIAGLIILHLDQNKNAAAWIRKTAFRIRFVLKLLINGAPEIHGATTAAADSSKESFTSGASIASSQEPVGWIGIYVQNKGDAAVVTSVTADSPGAKAGIQVGDNILALDGRLIKGKDFETSVAALKPGTEISINYARGSAAHAVSLTVGSHTM